MLKGIISGECKVDTDTDAFKTSKGNFQKIIIRTYFWGLTNIILMIF
jgi:hypothetical protein